VCFRVGALVRRASSALGAQRFKNGHWEHRRFSGWVLLYAGPYVGLVGQDHTYTVYT